MVGQKYFPSNLIILMNPRNQLDALIDRLRKLRASFVGLKFNRRSEIKPSLVPIKLRVEIVTLYEEYGGIDILTNLTNLSFNILKRWHKDYLRDPDFFMRTKNKMVVKIRKPEQYVNIKDTYAPMRRQEYKGMSTNEELEKLFPVHIANEIRKVKNQIDLRNSKNIPIDDGLR